MFVETAEVKCASCPNFEEPKHRLMSKKTTIPFEKAFKLMATAKSMTELYELSLIHI